MQGALLPIDWLHWSPAAAPIIILAFLLVRRRWTAQQAGATGHTTIPAMLLKDGRPVLACGTMGGEGQPQTQAAMVTRLIDFGFDVQQAIEAPRWLMGRTWGTVSSNLWLESRVSGERAARELRLRGQPVQMTAQWESTMGHARSEGMLCNTCRRVNPGRQTPIIPALA